MTGGDKMAEKGLGKGIGAGLGALFGEDISQNNSDNILSLPISKVEPKADQPRHDFDDEALEELAESLKRHGMIQPITVRKLDTGYYQIIAGERRWRAARKAGLDTVPVRIIEADDAKAMELALVENLQREDLNPIEEARGYFVLMNTYGLTQEQTAENVGKSRPAVANALRLLALAPQVLKMVEDGDLSAGHARALLVIKEPAHQLSAARKVMEQALSVRQTETLAARISKNLHKTEPAKNTAVSVNYVEEVEKSLTEALGRRVRIIGKRRTGRIELEFYNRDDMEFLISSLTELGKSRGGGKNGYEG